MNDGDGDDDYNDYEYDTIAIIIIIIFSHLILLLDTVNATNTNLTKKSLVFGWLTATNNNKNIEKK